MAVISHDVPMVRQYQNPICWVACAAMILSYRTRTSVTVESLIGYDPGRSSIMNPATSWAVFYRMLNDWGITSTGPQMSPSITYIEEMLRHNGPFILTHYTRTLAPRSTSPGTHAVVVSGINTNTRKCTYSNPWGTSNNSVDATTIQQSMQRLWLQSIRSVAYVSGIA
jgi:ABC-type bacteriocin/lantibiotic exporter with double-glycine peptidase domain